MLCRAAVVSGRRSGNAGIFEQLLKHVVNLARQRAPFLHGDGLKPGFVRFCGDKRHANVGVFNHANSIT